MIKKILHYRVVSLLFFASMVLVLGGAIWAIVAMLQTGTAPYILHFNDIDGITNVGGIGNIVLMGILGALIVWIDFLIALELEARDNVLGKIVAAVTLILAVLLFLGFVAILNVN